MRRSARIGPARVAGEVVGGADGGRQLGRARHRRLGSKGAPILGLDKAKKNSKGTYTVEFDAEWIARNGRACAGFMRMVWALGEKGEDWLAARYPEEGEERSSCDVCGATDRPTATVVAYGIETNACDKCREGER